MKKSVKERVHVLVEKAVEGSCLFLRQPVRRSFPLRLCVVSSPLQTVSATDVCRGGVSYTIATIDGNSAAAAAAAA